MNIVFLILVILFCDFNNNKYCPAFFFFFFNDTATTEIYTFPYTTLFRSERCARAGDVLGRIGGDEFALLLPETNAEQALPIAERWATEFRAAPVGVAAHLTMSAGV